jgi:hypothetical protein
MMQDGVTEAVETSFTELSTLQAFSVALVTEVSYGTARRLESASKAHCLLIIFSFDE